jgi:hypothetical protein
MNVGIDANVCVRHKVLEEVSFDVPQNTECTSLTTPSSAIRSRRRCTMDFSSFMLDVGDFEYSNPSLTQQHLLGNAVHQEPAHAIVTIIDCDLVTCLIQLIRTRKTCWTRTDNGNPFPCAESRRIRSYPAHFEALHK